MAQEVNQDLQVIINSLYYSLSSYPVAQYVSKSPGKVNIGPSSYDNQNYLSNWIINDQTGGLGISDMDESIHADRYWWGNCITKWKGHLPLPRKVESQTLTVYTTQPLTTFNMEGAADWTTETGTAVRDGAVKHGGSYSWKLSDSSSAYKLLTWDADYQSKKVTWSCYVYNTGAYLTLDDGVTSADSAAQTAGASWQLLTVSLTLSANATRVKLMLINASGSDSRYFDDGAVIVPTATATSNVYMENFNGELYIAHGNVLYKLASGRATLTYINTLPAAITALKASLNSCLYIYLGDADEYWYMSTAEVCTETNVNDANLAVQWNDTLLKLSSTGEGDYSAAPNSATPTWATTGDITDIGADVETLFIGKDANGDDVVYAASHSWLMVLDFANTNWLNTALKLPDHPKGGKGACYWQGAHYISYGLGVKKYISGSTATISEVGLIKDDGLPVELNGEIVKLLGEGSADEMFALVDASLTAGNSRSGVYAYDGRAWTCWWYDSANNGAMHDCIISSAESGYALYWDVGGAIKYIDIHRGIANPEQLAGVQEYEAAGIHISPWFDKGTPAFDALLALLTTWAAKITTTETVAIRYRTDKSDTTLDLDLSGSKWELLETLNTTGEAGQNEETLASGAGLTFNSLQIRLDLARGATTTNTPDLQSLVASYELLTGADGNWIWTLTIPLDYEHGTSPKQKKENLDTAVQLGTLVPIKFRDSASDEPYYCRLRLLSANVQTGHEWEGQYVVQAIKII
uniref:Tail protein n=2 Tax=viral metagenome TaxID=1070528 RepID=A0A6M3J2Z4_9ZZZZ